MPSKSQKRNASRKRQKLRAKAAGMDGAYRTNFPVAAPAAASSDMRQFTSFKPGSKPGNLVMHTNAAISRVLRENTAAIVTGKPHGS